MARAIIPLAGFVVTFIAVAGAYPILAWLFGLPFDGAGAVICIAVGLYTGIAVAAVTETAMKEAR